jgi:hypothetical protein
MHNQIVRIDGMTMNSTSARAQGEWLRAAASSNRSLNRTLHSMPAFGLAFHASPNTVLLFRAG